MVQSKHDRGRDDLGKTKQDQVVKLCTCIRDIQNETTDMIHERINRSTAALTAFEEPSVGTESLFSLAFWSVSSPPS